MRNIYYGWFIALAFIAARCEAQQIDEYRDFKDAQGRTIKARMIEGDSSNVTIERSDGKKFIVPTSLFSEADQKYIKRKLDGSTDTLESDGEKQFRGAEFGTSAAKGLPTMWSATDNIVWKTAMPGFGASSPVTHGERIYLTCYSGFGFDKNAPGDQSNLKRHLICIDANTGKILWDTPTASRSRVQAYQGFIALHGFASSTPVCDDERIYCFFGSSGVYAFNLDGKLQWDADVGNKTHGFGTGASPVLVDDLLIVNANVESGTLRAFDKSSGREVWQASGVNDAWGSPVVVEANGRKEIVIDMKSHIKAFDAKTGTELWSCQGSNPPRYVCPTPIVHDGIVYALHGYHGPLSAIRPGGNGDVTDTHREWVRPKVASNVPSPVFANGYIFSVKSEGGIVSCVDASDGSVVYQERLRPRQGRIGRIYASPLAADGKVYFVSRESGTFVLDAGRNFKQLAHNKIEDDNSIFNGSPVVSKGRLLLRSDKFLYCIGKR